MSSAGITAVRTSVLIEQFEIGDNGITHKPTGWRFTAGEDFRPHEVEDMARRLWARHLEEKKRR